MLAGSFNEDVLGDRKQSRANNRVSLESVFFSAESGTEFR